MIENKKILLVLCCLTIFFPGSFVFGYPGVMAGQWQNLFGAGKTDVGRVMFFILAGTGFSMYLVGKIQEKISYHHLIGIGCLVCSCVMVFVGRATTLSHVYIWGFLSGFFCAFIYIPALTVAQKLFPENKGLATGVINLTFGGASAVMSPVFSHLLVHYGYEFTADFSAAVSIVVGTGAAFFIRLPESGALRTFAVVMSLKETLRLKSFWFLWLVWAFSGAAGISMIILSSVFGRHLGYEVTQYVYILIGFNITNGLGRIVCGRLSDIFPKQKILMTSFLLSGLAYLIMPHFGNLWVVSVLAAVIGISFGALFTVSAPLVSECFGLDNFGRIFGLVFTAYGFVAGFIGPWVSGMLLDLSPGNFTLVFSYFAALYALAAVLVLQVKKVV